MKGKFHEVLSIFIVLGGAKKVHQVNFDDKKHRNTPRVLKSCCFVIILTHFLKFARYAVHCHSFNYK